MYGRFGVNYLHYNHSLNDGALNYKGKLTLLTVPLMLDYHPFDNSGFRVSAGIAYNGNKKLLLLNQIKQLLYTVKTMIQKI